MGDIDRSQPQDDLYKHETASTPSSPPPSSWVDRVKSLIGISPEPKAPVSAAPGYEGKSPAQIADEMSK